MSSTYRYVDPVWRDIARRALAQPGVHEGQPEYINVVCVLCGSRLRLGGPAFEGWPADATRHETVLATIALLYESGWRPRVANTLGWALPVCPKCAEGAKEAGE